MRVEVLPALRESAGSTYDENGHLTAAAPVSVGNAGYEFAAGSRLVQVSNSGALIWTYRYELWQLS